ncbi:hypothetical protein C8R44DRAFT_985970 [Mycena epipterygia]|nr:hypothetical protein C8R44DRAFT_985970 [Mycena epipterygia]
MHIFVSLAVVFTLALFLLALFRFTQSEDLAPDANNLTSPHPNKTPRSKERRRRHNIPQRVVAVAPTPQRTNEGDPKLLQQQDKLRNDQLSTMVELHVNSVGRLHVSLLVKGVASYVFWHGPGLYPYGMPLSVGQLSFLNETIVSEPSESIINTAVRTVTRYPRGPPSLANIMSSFPNLDTLIMGTLPGNGVDEDFRSSIDEEGRRQLVEKAREVINDHNELAHQASAKTIANLFRLVQRD